MYLHVCWYGGEVLLDIRLFSTRQATIKGIGLRKRQWFKLKERMTTIDRYVNEKEFNHRVFKFKDWHL
jgi:hypothetical protein